MQKTSGARGRGQTTTWLVLAALAAILVAGNLLATGEVRTWWNVVTLGVVEGITEWLPISSTGHLLVVGKLLNFQENIGGTFEIFIQLGAILAVVAYYARDLIQQARALPSSAQVRHFWASIVIACIPAGVLGLLLRKWIKAVLFESPTTIAIALIVGGIILLVVERLTLRVTTTDVQKTSFKQALGIGVAQVFSLIPGVSRSASSVVGGMLAGLDRPTATTFSFYMAMPVLGAATVVDLLGSLDMVTSADVPRLIVGTVVAMITAWFSIGWLLRYIARHSWVSFGIYRIVAGLLILGLVAAGALR